MNTPDVSLKKRLIVCAASVCGFILLLVLTAIIFRRELALCISQPERLREWIGSLGFGGKLIFTALSALQVIFAVIHDGPFQIVGGLAYGTIIGTLLFLCGTAIGSAAAFLLSRHIGGQVVSMLFSGGKLNKFRIVTSKGSLYVLIFLLYLIPGTPKDMLSYCFGTTKAHLSWFLLLSTLGRLPTVLLTMLVADETLNRNYLPALTILSLLALLYFIGSIVYKRLYKKADSDI